MRIKLTVAYDGTAYVGYQSQVNGTAIQDVLEKALCELFGTPIRTMSASRTDTGGGFSYNDKIKAWRY